MRIQHLNIILGIIVLIVVASCSSSSTIQTGSYKYLYDYESRSLHPEYVLYHFSDDSTRVFFRIYSEELLYARTTAQSPFTTKIKINCKISNDNSADTMSIQIQDAAKAKKGWLIGSFDIKMPVGIWNILFEFTDVTKSTSQNNYFKTDKSTAFSAHNYLLKDASTHEPIFRNTVTTGKEIVIESKRNDTLRKPYLAALDYENKLPPPPFSSSLPELPDLLNATYNQLYADSFGLYHLSIENKNYFFTHDETLQNGIFFRTSTIDFPEVGLAKSLEWPLRYITTKTEYDQITKSTYPKKMIDNFWIECGGNKNRARDLIRIYYSRVEEANYYFSSYTDGWRTDRGMIHLIFGNPTKIDKLSNREIWQYGEDNTNNQLVFVFNKENNPLSNNIYTLRRDPAFKQYWERMVTVWRNGRIYND